MGASWVLPSVTSSTGHSVRFAAATATGESSNFPSWLRHLPLGHWDSVEVLRCLYRLGGVP